MFETDFCLFFFSIIYAVGDKVPSIPRIQQFIESAWTNGESFDGTWNHLLYHFHLNHPKLPVRIRVSYTACDVIICNAG